MKRIAFAARAAIEVLLCVAAVVMILTLPRLLDDTSSTMPQTSTGGARPLTGNEPGQYDAYIARALAPSGGYLGLGRGALTLHCDNARLEGYKRAS